MYESMAKMPANILLICTDQHRYDFLGYNGADWLRTPNIDRIGREGTIFTHCVTNAPLCLPSRTAMAAGVHPHRIGCLDNGSYFPLSHRTYYQRLRDYGYWTGYGGKLDLAKPREAAPLRYNRPDGLRPEDYAFGFCSPCKIAQTVADLESDNSPYGTYLKERGWYRDFVQDRLARARSSGIPGVTAAKGGSDLRTVDMPDDWVVQANRDSILPSEDHTEAFIARHAMDWLDSVSETSPWFYQVNFIGPNEPFFPPSEFAEKYRDAAVPDPIPAETSGKPGWVERRFVTEDREQIRFTRRQYSAFIEMIDHWIGRILGVIESRGMAENTFIIFTSDHGEMLGDFGIYAKSVAYEPSIRVPLAICGPGLARGHRSDALVELIDLNATICELAGLPPQENIDARSLVPVLSGERTSHRDHVLTALSHFRCVRSRKWKFIRSLNDIEELYDLEHDPRERENLAQAGGEAGKVRTRLSRQLDQLWREGMWRR